MAKRKHIIQDTEADVLARSGRRCCLCYGLLQDMSIKRGQIAHLDHDPSNPDIDNLAFLCFDHHDEYDSKTRQSKGLKITEVKRYREELYADVDDLRTTTKLSFKQNLQLIERSLHVVEDDFFRKLLSEREIVKVERGLSFVYTRINDLLNQGLEPRNDGFFDKRTDNRSVSDEILEGLLFKCRDEHEEKKLKYLANIYTHIAFTNNITAKTANWLLQFAQELTYRQMCILSLVGQNLPISASWGPNDGDPAFEMEYKALEPMWRRGFSPEAKRAYHETGEKPMIVELSRVGDLCYQALGLLEIDIADLRELKPFFPNARVP